MIWFIFTILYTVPIRRLDTLNLVRTGWFGFCLKPIFATVPAVLKNTTHFKSGQKWLKNCHLAFFCLNPWHTLLIFILSWVPELKKMLLECSISEPKLERKQHFRVLNIKWMFCFCFVFLTHKWNHYNFNVSAFKIYIVEK